MYESTLSLVIIACLILIYMILGISYFSVTLTKKPTSEKQSIISKEYLCVKEFYAGDKGNIHGNVGLGNSIAVYAYMYLTAESEGKDFKYYGKNSHTELTNIFPSLPLEAKFDKPSRNPKLVKRHALEQQYPHDINHYQDSRHKLIQVFGTQKVPASRYDVVVHVRTDDIGNGHQGYTPLPSSFYERVLKSISSKQTVLIVCRKPHDHFTKSVLNAAMKGIKAVRGVSRVDIQSNSVKEDFYALLSAKVLVLSVSTLAFWGAFLSPNVKEVHIPYFGVMSASEQAAGIYTKEWQSTKNTKIVIHDMPKGFVKIRKVEALFN